MSKPNACLIETCVNGDEQMAFTHDNKRVIAAVIF
ncbi:MAG: hypothetical protein ACI9HK_003675, partial [Pirellulaceae bacterium]